MRFAMRLGGSRADSEDAVQEALTALWSHRDAVPHDKGKSFILTATARPETSQQADERFDMREAIELSLKSLPEVQRAILQLRDVEGYSYQEIASTLSLSDQQVQVYLFRARVGMRKQLIQMGYDNQDR